MRATIADPGWLDCSCCHLSVLVKNTSATDDSNLVPLTKSINGAFSRGRLISGMVLEDVLEYARVSHIYDVMRPKQGSDMDRVMGFPELYNSTTQAKEVISIRDGESKRVWHKPCFGLMYQDKWIPTNYAPLTFEFTLGEADSWLDTGATPNGTGELVDNSTSWELHECFLHYDILTLDAEVQSSYAAILRRGESLNVGYHASLMQSQTVLSAAFQVQIMRNLARVKSILVTLSQDDEDKTKVASTQLFHPPVPATNYPDSGIEVFVQIGGRKIPHGASIGPMDSAQLWFALQKAAGVQGSSIAPLGMTYQEFLNTDTRTGKRSFIYATEMEKVISAGFSGEDFGGGRALLIDMKNVGTDGPGAENTRATRCHVLLVHEAAMSISESGVQVTS